MGSDKNAKKKRTPELKVVFDTNVVWTDSVSELLKQDVSELINLHAEHADLSIAWYLPETVRHERQFKMLKNSRKLLPSIEKLEKLLGHNLNITEEIVDQRINDVVERQIKAAKIQLLSFDPANVDWKSVMLLSAYRQPPFDPGENEKGFRDALIAESFLQLVSVSPKSPKMCRIALVTNDALLADALKPKIRDAKNVSILQNLEELKALINTLAADVTEEFVAKIKQKATGLFFTPEQKDSLYYKMDIYKSLSTKYDTELKQLPAGASVRENGAWYIASPRFVDKKRQRVFWATRISVDAKAYDFVVAKSQPETGIDLKPFGTYSSVLQGPLSTLSGPVPLAATPSVKPEQPGLIGLWNPDFSKALLGSMFPPAAQKRLLQTGKSIFEVNWSAIVTTTQKFSSCKIESIDFIETIWEIA
jgi:hypothetical protein